MVGPVFGPPADSFSNLVYDLTPAFNLAGAGPALVKGGGRLAEEGLGMLKRFTGAGNAAVDQKALITSLDEVPAPSQLSVNELVPNVPYGPGYAYGPFHRLPSDKTELAKVTDSGEVWGFPARNTYRSDLPVVKAYNGPLPTGASGYEFYSPIKPSASLPFARWYSDPLGKASSRSSGDAAGIPCSISRVGC